MFIYRKQLSQITGIFLLLLTIFGSIGSATTEISLVAQANYLLFATILMLSASMKYKHPITVLSIGLYSIIVSILSGAQYLYLILPALIIFANPKNNENEPEHTGLKVYLTVINAVCFTLVASTIYKHGLHAGFIREDLYRDPNFFALFFLVLSFPLVFGGKVSKIISLMILGTVLYLTLSRALLLGMTFQLAALLALRNRQYRLTRVVCALALIFSVTYPFITGSLFVGEIHNYSIGFERILQFNDLSNFGRNQQIIESFEYILDKNLYYHGMDESQLSQKPHNWFWLIAIRFGLLSAITFFALLIISIYSTSIRIAIICASSALATGFLDFFPLVSILYGVISYYVAIGIIPGKWQYKI